MPSVSANRSKIEVVERSLRIREVACSYAALPPVDGETVSDPAVAARILSDHFNAVTDPTESLMAIFLSSKNKLIAVERLYRGTVASCQVAVRDVIRTALMLNASSLIVAHNHPSGDPAPSNDDVNFSRRLDNACKIMGVDLHDSLVLGFGSNGQHQFVSLRQRRYL